MANREEPRDFVDRLLNEAATSSQLVPHATSAFYDKTKYKRGQEFFHKHFASVMFGHLVGLTIGLSEPNLNFILRHTKMTSKPGLAYRRYLSVVKHLLTWMQEDFSSPELWTSLRYVENKHRFIPIKQKDLGLTLLGFVGPIFGNLGQFGLQDSDPDDLVAFLHVWRNIGYAMGLTDEFNICTSESIDFTRDVSIILMQGYIADGLRLETQQYYDMLDAFCTGFGAVVPIPGAKAMLEHSKQTIRNYNKSKSFDFTSDESLSTQLAVTVFRHFCEWQRFHVVRTVCNFVSKTFVWIAFNVPVIAKLRKYL